VAEPLRERPALSLAPAPAAGAAGPHLHERASLCLTQVIVRPGKDWQVGRLLGLALPMRPNTTSTDGDIVVFCLRPRDWLIVTLDAEGRKGGVALEARKRLGSLAAAIDQSHGRVVLRLDGKGARALLQMGCNLDLDGTIFPPGAMAQTGLDGIALMVHCLDAERFDLYVARSYAAGLARWLAHHGAVPNPGKPS
jgi:heterotetrameric sarcosine oxidase gamma subunit